MNPIVATESVNVFSADRVAGYAATAVLTLLGLVITVLILKKLLYKPILKVIHDRQSKVDALLQDAESRQAAIKSQTERLQEEADEAKTAAGALLKSAREQADAQREAILSDAKREAAAILAKAERDRAQMLASDETRIYNEAVNIAVQAVGHFVMQGDASQDAWSGVREMLAGFVADEQARRTAGKA